ncbi:MAG: zinc-binding dehydrogenase [Victivallales bacterium]|nr:zinc-binding dehydrogenase [Victivallales bacterium]
MKQLQILEPGKVVWQEVPEPEAAPGEVLVKVAMVNTCPHWDMHLLGGIPMFAGGTINYPYTGGQPGHEAVGEVVALGEGVTDLAVGTRVACWKDAGHHRPGCYAQYVAMTREHVLPLPDSVTWEQACSLELAMCVQVSVEQLLRNDFLVGKRIGISGLGPAGLVALQLVKAQGAESVVGVDPVAERRDMALAAGADIVIEPTAEDWDKQVGGNVHATIDCTGFKVSIEFMLQRTVRAVCIFGVLRETVEFKAAYWGGRSLFGYEPHNVGAAQRALDLIAEGKLDLTDMITAKLPFTRYNEGIEMLKRKEATKICFLPWAE